MGDGERVTEHNRAELSWPACMIWQQGPDSPIGCFLLEISPSIRARINRDVVTGISQAARTNPQVTSSSNILLWNAIRIFVMNFQVLRNNLT